MVDPCPPLVEPLDVFAHLFFAVGTRDEVLLASTSGNAIGWLGNPVGSVLPFTTMHVAHPWVRGEPVIVEYASEEEPYHFFSEVVRASGETVEIRVPPAIERTERRRAARVDLPRLAEVSFRPSQSEERFPVFNASASGLAFVTRADRLYEVGQTLDGELLVGGDPAGILEVEVRHSELRGDERGVGVHIRAAPLALRGHIARLLVQWMR